MRNLKIAMKQLVGFGLVIVLAVTIGVVGVIGITSLQHGLESLYDAAAPLAELASSMESFQTARGVVWEAIVISELENSAAELRRCQDELNEEFEIFKTNMLIYKDSISSQEALSLYDEIMEYFERDIEHGFHDVIAAAMQGAGTEELKDMLYSYDYLADAVTVDLDRLFVLRDGTMDQINQEDQELADRLLMVIIVVIIVALAIAVFIGIYVSKIISDPLKVLRGYMDDAGSKGSLEMTPVEAQLIPVYSGYKDEIGDTFRAATRFFGHVTHIAQQLESISNGDLTVHVEVLSDEDILGNSLQRMEDNLNEMFGNISASTIQVATGSKQVADGAQSLAQGSTEQAASIQELSASISDIATSTKANAETAAKTAELSQTIRGNAEKGSRQMDDMINAVKDINEASLSISKIIKTIDDIAFQTNILALNAAVEAARAGQHGKGFAVVAEEVRNLASKSAEAAKDTGDMIQNSMSKAELGSQIAGETAESLREIVSGISESSDLISQIAQASEDQSTAISQINTGVDQVAQVVQQNSATAQQSAAASEQMSGQSDMLQQLIAQFKTKNTGYRPAMNLPLQASVQHAQIPVKTNDSSFDDGSDFGKY